MYKLFFPLHVKGEFLIHCSVHNIYVYSVLRLTSRFSVTLCLAPMNAASSCSAPMLRLWSVWNTFWMTLGRWVSREGEGGRRKKGGWREKRGEALCAFSPLYRKNHVSPSISMNLLANSTDPQTGDLVVVVVVVVGRLSGDVEGEEAPRLSGGVEEGVVVVG